MYQRALTEEQFADLWEGMSVAGRADAGWIYSWTGTHPATGALTIVKDWQSGAIVLSQLPVPDWIFGECGANQTAPDGGRETGAGRVQEQTFSETINGEIIEATYTAESTKMGTEVTVFYGGRRKVIYDGSLSTECARRMALVDLVREAGR